mgnify:CR=1 FL=1
MRLISNLETESVKLIQIILVGQPELRASVDHPALRQLRQEPPLELERAGLAEVWAWARVHWSGARLRGLAALPVLP